MVAPIIGAAARAAGQAAASKAGEAAVDAATRRRLDVYGKLRGTPEWADVPAEYRAELDAERRGLPDDIDDPGIASRGTAERRAHRTSQGKERAAGGRPARGRRSAQAPAGKPLPTSQGQRPAARAAASSRSPARKSSRRPKVRAPRPVATGARRAVEPLRRGTAEGSRLFVYALGVVALLALLRAPGVAARLLEAPARALEWFADATTGVPYGPAAE